MTWHEKKAQSIAILDKYKNEISQEAYDRILYVISTQAIEDIFPDEQDIKDLVRIAKGEITTEAMVQETIKRYQKEWDVA